MGCRGRDCKQLIKSGRVDGMTGEGDRVQGKQITQYHWLANHSVPLASKSLSTTS